MSSSNQAAGQKCSKCVELEGFKGRALSDEELCSWCAFASKQRDLAKTRSNRPLKPTDRETPETVLEMGALTAGHAGEQLQTVLDVTVLHDSPVKVDPARVAWLLKTVGERRNEMAQLAALVQTMRSVMPESPTCRRLVEELRICAGTYEALAVELEEAVA